MNNELLFSVKLPFLQTEFKPLMNLAVTYKKKEGLFEWIFYAKDIEEVIRLVKRTLCFDQATIKKLIQYCPPLKTSLNLPEWKGKGELTIERTLKAYILKEWVKSNSGTPKQISHEVPIEIVNTVKSIISTFEIGVWVTCKKLAERIVNALNITRFNRPTSNTFNWGMFLGTRKDYFMYYYYPVKVLEHKGFIKYHKRGKILRLIE